MEEAITANMTMCILHPVVDTTKEDTTMEETDTATAQALEGTSKEHIEAVADSNLEEEVAGETLIPTEEASLSQP